jgi:ABC-2 type transport system ATP-binding protein
LTWAHVRELKADGVTVVLTTHLLDEAEELADRVVIIDGGRLVADGTPAELMHEESHEVLFVADPGLDLAALAAALDAPVHERRPGRYLVAAAGTPQRLARLTAWLADRDVQLRELTSGHRSLEDVFLRLTAEDRAAERAQRSGRGTEVAG